MLDHENVENLDPETAFDALYNNFLLSINTVAYLERVNQQ